MSQTRPDDTRQHRKNMAGMAGVALHPQPIFKQYFLHPIKIAAAGSTYAGSFLKNTSPLSSARFNSPHPASCSHVCIRGTESGQPNGPREGASWARSCSNSKSQKSQFERGKPTKLLCFLHKCSPETPRCSCWAPAHCREDGKSSHFAVITISSLTACSRYEKPMRRY